MSSEPLPPLTGTTCWTAKGGATTGALIVLFHGYDSNGEQFSGLSAEFRESLPGAYFFAPDGPLESAPGSDRRRWFQITGQSTDDIYAALGEICDRVNQTVDAVQRDIGLGDGETAFVGFSQGATVALHAALRRAHPIAGVLSFAGQTVMADRLSADARSFPPVHLVHGRDDTVVPPARFAATMEGLMKLGVPVTTRMCQGAGHTINGEGLRHGLEFLAAALPVPEQRRRSAR